MAKASLEELQFLDRRDLFHRKATSVFDMSERTLDVLLRYLQQGHGKLPTCGKDNEFALLTQDETDRIEAIYAEAF